MGSYQSKSTPAERAVITRLRALEFESKCKSNGETDEDEFVEVDGTETPCLSEKTLDDLRHAPTTLDVGQLEDWQTKLLQDPKNRYVRTLPTAVTVLLRPQAENGTFK